jgi:hypothetical protein
VPERDKPLGKGRVRKGGGQRARKNLVPPSVNDAWKQFADEHEDLVVSEIVGTTNTAAQSRVVQLSRLWGIGKPEERITGGHTEFVVRPTWPIGTDPLAMRKLLDTMKELGTDPVELCKLLEALKARGITVERILGLFTKQIPQAEAGTDRTKVTAAPVRRDIKKASMTGALRHTVPEEVTDLLDGLEPVGEDDLGPGPNYKDQAPIE